MVFFKIPRRRCGAGLSALLILFCHLFQFTASFMLLPNDLCLLVEKLQRHKTNLIEQYIVFLLLLQASFFLRLFVFFLCFFGVFKSNP